MSAVSNAHGNNVDLGVGLRSDSLMEVGEMITILVGCDQELKTM